MINVFYVYLDKPFITVMSHHTSDKLLDPTESKFLDLMQRGDDFYKVELLRPARSWYQKALEMNIDTEKVRKKMAECDKQIAFEMRVIMILAAIAAVIILSIIIF